MADKKKIKQSIGTVFKNNIYMLKQVAHYTPGYFVFMIIEGVVWGLINSAEAIFTFNLLNSVEYGGNFGKVVLILGIMALFKIITGAFDKWYWHIYNPLLKQKLHLKMQAELFKKAHTLDVACFDDPEFYNDFVWAMDQSDKRAVEVVEDTGKLINRVVASTALVSLMMTVSPWVAILILVMSVLTIVLDTMVNKLSFRQSKENNPLERKKKYINRVYRLADHAKELRISGADGLLMDEYDQNTEKLIEVQTRYGKKYFWFGVFEWMVLGDGIFFAMLIYLILQMNAGALQIGGFIAIISVYWRIRWLLSDLIERLTKYSLHSLFIEKYREFFKFEPTVKSGSLPVPEFESFELKNVSFSYDFDALPKYKFHDEDYVPPKKEANRDALKNVSLSFKKGEKLAIVGYNGAGKTTLIKLIMRLYDPTEGEILYNGTDVREFDVDQYRKRIGAVFQDFKIFATSIAENVMNGEYSESDDKEKVLNALDMADFSVKLDSLEDGIETKLTREFDEKGTNLSGGEQQKIAIARVFASNCDMMILDEPSSALDPNAEYRLNQAITEKTKDKTVVFISHRLSTTRMADRIYMFAGGRLQEEGSHAELMARNGKYAEMFRLQSEKYELTQQ
ncbi:MAG: ABC transporter ATP-binding protein [Clostridia bacterium]|nr:ABC transporter ATP-binding protein [Clostridia bacterium]